MDPYLPALGAFGQGERQLCRALGIQSAEETAQPAGAKGKISVAGMKPGVLSRRLVRHAERWSPGPGDGKRCRRRAAPTWHAGHRTGYGGLGLGQRRAVANRRPIGDPQGFRPLRTSARYTAEPPGSRRPASSRRSTFGRCPRMIPAFCGVAVPAAPCRRNVCTTTYSWTAAMVQFLPTTTGSAANNVTGPSKPDSTSGSSFFQSRQLVNV